MSNWYKIENKAKSKPTLWIYDEIGGYGIDARQFVDELNQLEADEIDVHINSVGGEVFAGFAIYQALRDHAAKVNVFVDAIAASIASVITMAGDKVTMAESAQLMIHDGHVAIQGNAADLTRMIDTLDRTSNSIASVYAARCGGTTENWREAMRSESWYNAEEAVVAGLADEIAKSPKRTTRNVADLKIFNYAGRDFAPAPKIVAAHDGPHKNPDKPYGDVPYADPGYQDDSKKRYPIDTEDHVRAAWSYINQEDNASKYTPEQLAKIKTKIKAAAKKFGIEISDSITNDFDTDSFLQLLKGAFTHD